MLKRMRVSGNGMSAVDATLLEIGTGDFGEEGVDPDPEQREDGGQQNGPHNDDGGHAVLPAHEPFQERIQVHDYPEGKEELAE